jgi:GTPase SAR1 family protein
MMKILLMGDDLCGKSTLLERFVHDSHRLPFTPRSTGLDFEFKTLCASGKNIKLQIWDIHAQERFEHLRDITVNLMRNADAVFVCYDTTEDSSSSEYDYRNRRWRVQVGDRIARVKREAQQRKCNVQIYVVGLKSDLPPSKETEAYVRAMLEEHELEAWRWITVSSKTGERVEMPFYAAAVQHVQNVASKGTN